MGRIILKEGVKPRIYVAGPIKGKQAKEEHFSQETVHNTNGAIVIATKLLEHGYIPFLPHLSVYWAQFIEVWNRGLSAGLTAEVPPEKMRAGGVDSEVGTLHMPTHSEWLELDIQWIDLCHGMYRIPGESKGADIEAAHFNKLGRPIFNDMESLLAWDFDSPYHEVPIIEGWINKWDLGYRADW